MLSLESLIDDVGGQTALAAALQAIVDKTSEQHPHGSEIPRRVDLKLVHYWKRTGAVSRPWLPIVAVLCRSRGIILDAESIVALAGGRNTLRHVLDAMGIESLSQENLDRQARKAGRGAPGRRFVGRRSRT